MARRKTKTNLKKAQTSTSAATTKLINNNSSTIMKDDPGGTEEGILNDRHHSSSRNLTNRTNGINVNFLKASKDQASVIDSLVSSASSVQYSNFPATNNTATTASVTILNNNNDSKYLHKKFKKFCATVDSNQETNHQNKSYSHTSDISKVVESAATAANSNNTGLLINNNNSETVEDKNSWSHNSHHQVTQVPSQTPKHLQTTDEEKQLVKDIIDINNENFMHQGVNYAASSFLITPNPSSGSVGVSNGNIVTTLGNHNTNFQLNEIRHKVVSSQEASAFNQTANGNFVIINSHPLSDYPFAAHQTQQQPLQQQHSAISLSTSVPTSSSLTTTSGSLTSSSSGSSTPGRYICPYCQLNCAKPSVLQKHIRAHTNERPYPCTPCGFAFKTKSNLYKHCRSRAHIQRTDPTNVGLITASIEEDGCSLESGDIDETDLLSSQNESLNHHRLSSPLLTMESQLNGNFGENSSSSSSNSSSAVLYPVNSSSDTSSVTTKPYKPKFHNYKKLDLSKTNALQISTAPISTPPTPSTPSFFSTNVGNLTPQIIEERISRIISDNEAIIDNVEALLQKKYHKITGIQRNLSTSSSVNSFPAATTSADQATQSNSKLALALLKQQQQQKQHDEEILRYQMTTQPLNLIKMQEPLSVDVGSIVSSAIPKKKYFNENSAPLVITTQNPQDIIIIQPAQLQQMQEKPSQLVIPTSHPQNPEGSIIKDLLLNSKNFGAIDGEAGDGTYTCPTCKVSFRGAEILKYHLICHCGDESIISRSAPISPTSSNNNNSNASSPYHPRSSNEKHSPSSLSTIAHSQIRPTNSVISPRTPSSLQKLAKSQLKVPKQKPDNIVISPAISAIKITANNQQALIKNPLPSPGPLLGNTRLVDKRFEEEFNVMKQKLEYQSSSNEKKVSPFFDMKFMHEKLAQSKNFSSGGSFVALESSNEMQTEDISPNIMMQCGLSGGILEVPLKKEPSPNDHPPITPKLIVTITPTLTPTLTTNTTLFTVGGKNHFQFPPSVSIYNPLTLPLLSSQQACGTQSIVHGGRVIPYVPGIPGPNTMSIVNKNDLPPPPAPLKDKRLNSPSMKQNGIIAPREVSPSAMPRPNGVLAKKKSFNFARIAENLEARGKKSPEGNESRDETMKESKTAFLRPTSLPLKPGTFTPKQHHGITPTANTLPLISPETPRPSKSCVQLYLNGHAYTYLGLKSSTKPFYCTVNKPQPSYIQNQHKLSMYSNWQIYNGNNPNIFDLSPFSAMSLYDSRQRSSKYAVAMEDKKELVSLVEMQSVKVTPSIVPTNYQVQQITIKDEHAPPNNNITPPMNHSNMASYDHGEEYTYIRGRGRGKYICQECGIRCKKPSMLKKHIRTHTDLRPYTCSYCEFSFKTKGNLTKHMKSKAHFKKCSELGISPIPTMPDDDMNDFDDCSESSRRMTNGKDESSRCDSETEDNDSEDDLDDDSGDEDTDESKSRMPEHEAAQLLLSLSNHAGTRPPSENSMPLTHQPIAQNDRSESSAVPRSRIIFSQSKPGDFDFHEMGIKYYSDPSLSHPKDVQVPRIESFDENDEDTPMDLTKKAPPPPPPPQSARVSQIIATISGHAIHNQLVSNTDKIPSHHQVQGTSMNFTDTIQYSESFLPSEYHMERALKDARNKQIQQAGKVSEYERVQETPIREQNRKLEDSLLFVTKSTSQPQTSSSVKSVMMDALAELAANSDKLEIKPDESKNIAKNVASEYLKLTQQKIVHRQDENSVENSSDQETQESSSTILLTPQNIVVGEDGFHKKVPTTSTLFNNDPLLYSHLQDDSGRPVCVVCQKTFQKASQLKIHMNIHYMERKYRCEACSVSFRTQGHLQKHERSVSHQNKVNMTSTFGVPTVSNPRPFKCKDCKIAFRIHGHLAKHLRSKMHVLKLECLQKLPFGTYAEMERAGFNLTDIDTSDCDNSLMSLRTLAKKLNEKDPTKLGPLPPLPNDDSGDFDENYDSDSSLNEEDSVMLKRKMIMDESEFENIKKIKQTESHDHVPSHPNINDDEKNACAKN